MEMKSNRLGTAAFFSLRTEALGSPVPGLRFFSFSFSFALMANLLLRSLPPRTPAPIRPAVSNRHTPTQINLDVLFLRRYRPRVECAAVAALLAGSISNSLLGGTGCALGAFAPGV